MTGGLSRRNPFSTLRTFEHIASYSSDPRAGRGGVTVPRIWVTVVLSVLIHALVLWQFLPKLLKPSSDSEERSNARGALSVQLAPRPNAQAVPRQMPSLPQRPQEAVRSRPEALARAPRAPRREAQPRVAVRPETRPPPIALNKPGPSGPSPAPPERAITPPTTPKPPAAGDLASYIEAQRQARGESTRAAAAPESAASAPPPEDANARANRIAAANLGSGRKPDFGADRRRGGGVFQIQRLAYDYAEFLFYGWNKDIRRNTQQTIEVRKGANSDIRIAVVRKMIAIIREHEQGDFVWESRRLGRDLTLSARAKDTSGLEEFMLREFFEDDRRP